MEQLKTITINHLRYFISVYELGGISLAAKTHGVTQSAITKSIKSFENQLDLPLFHRDTQNIHPTEAAKTLYPKVQDICFAFSTMGNTVDVIHKGDHGEIKIGVGKIVAPIATQLLSELFSNHFPNLKLSIQDDGPEGLYKKLLQDEIDFFILYSKADRFFSHTDQLIIKKLIDLEIVAVISPETQQFEDITDYRWALPQVTESFLQCSAFLKPYKDIEAKSNIAYEIDLNHARISLAEEGKAATIVPMFLVKDKVESGRLMRLSAPLEKFELSVFYLSTKPLSNNSKLILDRFREHFSNRL
ncbi:LysR family transcriptional regulator [Vibrio marisflavi]|uniref:HTH-type transcriptional regulator ArgP n=1 Tax=Vibrio marisflavi CECT 7928 TaxID=634439 RepID=A0ABN8E410_9VIBR|nr:LysR family transcriptional regulator [Vibrio marisflavi]CAH0537756.1 HTH-type transcriptional regulator ArgP [Vibrio marisflavi CECT 7928]